MQVFMGSIMPFAFNFAPKNWAQTNGQLLSIQQNAALFSLLGTYYGGNGVQNFQLPNLQGRSMFGMGNGAGLSPRVIGEVFGVESTTVPLNVTNLPTHNHTLAASNTVSTSLTQAPASGWTLGAAASNIGGRTPVITPVNMYNAVAVPPQSAMPSAATSTTGGGAPLQVATVPPALCLNFCIALFGIFPSRN
jgi:microcystin-dependent protein